MDYLKLFDLFDTEEHKRLKQIYLAYQRGPEPQSKGPEPQSKGPEPQSKGPESQSKGSEPQSKGPEPQYKTTENTKQEKEKEKEESQNDHNPEKISQQNGIDFNKNSKSQNTRTYNGHREILEEESSKDQAEEEEAG